MVGAGSDPLNKGISGEMRASAEAAVYRWVAQSARKMTAAHLEKRLARRCYKSRAAARRMIRQMVSGGRLRYIYIYGQHLERFSRLLPNYKYVFASIILLKYHLFPFFY